MDTIKNYIRYYKDVTFDESPFNDVDNLIFSSLTYLNFNFIKDNMTIKEIGTKYFQEINYKNIKSSPVLIRKTIDNFELLFSGKRYQDITISSYLKVVDNEKQFGALTYHLPNNTIYIAYQGTDDSVIGWREDFDMSYKFPVPSQKMAIDYINKVVKFRDRKIIVGGHSKGGNLAMTASMYAKGHIKRRIVKVYNNDGPGFRSEQANSKEYREMSAKLKAFVPEEGIVGLLFNHTDKIVVKSNGIGLFQHDLNNWNCYGPILIKSELKKEYVALENKIQNWLELHDDIKRKQIVDTIFETLKKSDIIYLSQLRQFKLAQFIKLFKMSRNIDKESKDLVINAFKTLFNSD